MTIANTKERYCHAMVEYELHHCSLKSGLTRYVMEAGAKA